MNGCESHTNGIVRMKETDAYVDNALRLSVLGRFCVESAVSPTVFFAKNIREEKYVFTENSRTATDNRTE